MSRQRKLNSPTAKKPTGAKPLNLTPSEPAKSASAPSPPNDALNLTPAANQESKPEPSGPTPEEAAAIVLQNDKQQRAEACRIAVLQAFQRYRCVPGWTTLQIQGMAPTGELIFVPQ